MFWLCFFLFLAACFGAGATGGLFPPGPWYERLNKPTWTPPNWLFPVAWTTLYLFMSYAGALAAMGEENGVAMALWSVQIALNALWTPVFFGLRRLKLGMIVLACLWVAVFAAMIALWQVNWLAGLLFFPYLVWVSVAGALNLSVIRLNPDVAANPPELS